MSNEINVCVFSLENVNGDQWEDRTEAETAELVRKKQTDLHKRSVRFGAPELVSIT